MNTSTNSNITIIIVIIAVLFCLSCLLAVGYSFIRNNSQFNLLFSDYVFWIGMCSCVIVVIIAIIAVAMNSTNISNLNKF